MAYDAARRQVVLFGGYDGRGNLLSDTWVWDGTNWTQKSPLNSPGAVAFHAMAYDAAHGQVVLFGGSNFSSNYPSDTWVWDGTNWTRKTPLNSPAPRGNHAMAYDTAHGQVVLFGGEDFFSDYLNDTWAWDGTNWTQKSPLNSPTPLGGHAMAYDAARGQVVLFGGHDARGNLLGNTWVWDGTNWTQETPLNSPAPRVFHAMAYDTARGQAVLFGGIDSLRSQYFNDTWVWDGTNWTWNSPLNSPTPRIFQAMAYDAAHGQAVLFGGDDNLGSVLNDTWVWSAGIPIPLGSISVTTNLPAASFTITGPANYSGSGTSFSQANAPVGNYTITYGPVSGYSAPPDETGTLAAGGTVGVHRQLSGHEHRGTNLHGARFGSAPWRIHQLQRPGHQ
jgi:hypothetical protein